MPTDTLHADDTRTPDQLIAEARNLIREGAFDEAVHALERAAASPPHLVDSLSLMGVLAFKMGNYAMAIRCFTEVENLPGASADVPEVLAVLYCLAGRLTEGLFYGKLAATRPLDQRLLGELGERFPRFQQVFYDIRERPLAKEGERQLRLGAYGEAINWFTQHLALFENEESALDGLAQALLADGRPQAAIGRLAVLHEMAPTKAAYASRLGSALTLIGNFEDARAMHRQATSLASGDPILHTAALADLTFVPGPGALADAAAEIKALHEMFGPAQPDRLAASGNTPLRVGYLLSGLTNFDDVLMIADIASRHDRRKVSPVGFGIGDLTAKRNAVYRNCFDNWLNIADTDVHTLKLTIFNEEVDILVDLGGYGAPQLLEGFPLRLAPIQVSWLGSPFGPAADGYDFVLRDGLAAPQAAGAAKPWPMSGGLYAFARPASPLPVEACPARAHGHVSFGADVSLAELNPEVARAWSRILAATPNAQLLLMDRDLRDPRSVDRLLGLFEPLGMAQRIDVVTAASRDEFCREIDVLLTAFPHARPFAAATALALGVPVVALDQPGRTTADVAQLVRRLGLEADLMATTEDDYVAKAAALAANSGRREAFRGDIWKQVSAAPVFDIGRLTADLEAAFVDMRKAAASF